MTGEHWSCCKEEERKTRRGKGFSQDELSEVGLGLMQALRLSIPIDGSRRSKHKENVETLKKHLERDRRARKPTTLKS